MTDVVVEHESLQDIARRCYEEAGRETAGARVRMLSYLNDCPEAEAKHRARLVEMAVGALIEAAHIRLNNTVTRAADRALLMEEQPDLEDDLPALAAARARGHRQARKVKATAVQRLARIKQLGMRLYEYGLPGGLRLADATHETLLASAKKLMTTAADQVADAFWLQLIAAQVHGSKTVRTAGITWQTLIALKREAARRASAMTK